MKKAFQILFLLFFLGTNIGLSAQVPKVKLQSVFIYNFTKYIDWPDSYKAGNFVIGVLGSSPLTNELKTKIAARKKVGNQRIVVKQFNSIGSISKCHILFIPEQKSKGELILKKVNAKLAKSSTLVITEQAGMVYKGAAINFVVQNRKVGFELNLKTTAQHRLKVNSTLQKLATRVIK